MSDIDFDALKRQIHAELYDFDAEADVEGASNQADYHDGDGSLFPSLSKDHEQPPEDARLLNLEVLMTKTEARFEVVATYTKGLEARIRDLESELRGLKGSVGISSVRI